jgi:hypothetical protein
MKKAAFSLLVIVLLLAGAVPVLAGGFTMPPMDDGSCDLYVNCWPYPDDTNLGCSAAFWIKNPELIPDPYDANYFLDENDKKLRGMILEERTADVNFAEFGDSLTDAEIGHVVAAAAGADKFEYKGFNEYLKLWNKGWAEDPLNDPKDVNKTCPDPDDPRWDTGIWYP